MSVVFLTAAFSARVGKSTTKSVLVAVADRADDKTGLCFPSIADVVERTELNRKTVISCLKTLEERKFLVDTGKRVGATNQVKIWRLDLVLIQEASQKRDSYQEASQKRNCSVFPVEESRFSAITVPKTGHETTTEPSFNKTTTNHVQEVDIEELIEAATWQQKKFGFRKTEELFRAGVRKRLLRQAQPSYEDIKLLSLWHREQLNLENGKPEQPRLQKINIKPATPEQVATQLTKLKRIPDSLRAKLTPV
jgi:hypothetical protein